MTSQVLTIYRILECVRANKNLKATQFFIDSSKALDSIQRGKMEPIFLAYSLPKETVAVIRMLYKNTEVKVCSRDGDTDYLDIVAGGLQGDIITSYLFIICLDHLVRTPINLMKENGFKGKKQKIPSQTIKDVNYTDDIEFLANSPAQAKSLIHSLGQGAGSIGLHINADEKEYLCFNRRGQIFTLNLCTSSPTSDAASN